ncbi:MAG: efflux RND transporter permease subunit [Microscillaceae bacterium]|nr:efflux RND transporter permease subunit [Microscillaceae bacterium]
MSTLSTNSIARPVLTLVTSIVITLFGVIGFFYLGIREFPSVDPPVINVTTTYVGANADIIVSQITEPIEEAVNGVDGIRSITSTSKDGASTVTVEFNLEVDLERAANDVRDKVSQAVGNLPDDAEPPIVSKADADANPIIAFSIQSNQTPLLELTRIANDIFKERLQTISGVSQIFIWGAKEYSMRLWMDPLKLSAYELTPLDVRDALVRQNVELPSGIIEGNKTELSIRTLGKITTVTEFNDLIIKQDGENIVRFSDIGRAELGPENLRTILKRDGVPAVGVAIVPQPGSNQIEIADNVYKRMEEIQKNLPKDNSLKVQLVFDTSKYVRESIVEVQQTIYTAFILVVLVIFLFLRDWRTTVIPVLAIPVSLIGAFFIMYLAGYSINVLTLLGLVLAIGLVVDDAIVLMENIYAKVERGTPPMEAAVKGSTEIFFAVVATTIALVAVFLPIIFLQGLTGRLFVEFGVVISGSIIISAFVALTLTPMLSSRILKHSEKKNFFYRVTEPFFEGLTKGYTSSLAAFMKVRWMAFLIIFATGYAIYALYDKIPTELAPLEDRSMIRLGATGPEGATFEYMDQYMDSIIHYVEKNVPERDGFITVTSPGFGAASSVNQGFMRLRLKPTEERERSQQELVTAISKDLKTLTDAQAFLSQSPTIGDERGGDPIQFVVQSPSLDKLKEIIPKFMDVAQKSPVFSYVRTNLKFTKPELRVEINREKATKLNVSVRDIAETLQFSLSGRRFDYFIMDGKQYQVIGQVQRDDRDNPTDLTSIYVRNRNGEMIQLDNLIYTTEESTPPQLFRYNRYLSVTFSANLNAGYTIGDGIKVMNEVADKVLDDSYSTALAGQSKEFSESSSSLQFAFLFAIVLIYLILAAQFESFRDPFIILFTVPLAIGGALMSLWFFGETLNIFSQIGIIMLIGLVTKNGILLVEFANQRKNEGVELAKAIKMAAKARFRAILMTNASTVLGTLPIALALGAGSESRVAMGVAIVGGLIFATLLTLYVIPAMYTMMASKSRLVDKEALLEKSKEVLI